MTVGGEQNACPKCGALYKDPGVSTKKEVIAIVRAALDEIIARKRDLTSLPGPVADLLFQYASGAVAGGFEILLAVERASI